MSTRWSTVGKIHQTLPSKFTDFFEFGVAQKCANLVELERSGKINIYSQNWASIQLRTSLPKFGKFGKTSKIRPFTRIVLLLSVAHLLERQRGQVMLLLVDAHVEKRREGHVVRVELRLRDLVQNLGSFELASQERGG